MSIEAGKQLFFSSIWISYSTISSANYLLPSDASTKLYVLCYSWSAPTDGHWFSSFVDPLIWSWNSTVAYFGPSSNGRWNSGWTNRGYNYQRPALYNETYNMISIMLWHIYQRKVKFLY